jgi:ABC-type transporter Mla subunit MlaD
MISKLLLLILMASLSASAQVHHRDPLTDAEVNKVRDAAQLPEDRLKLYIEFARARLDKLQQAHADQKAADRAQQTRDALQDFVDVYDELDTNVDTYADRGDDLRKALKPVIEADTEFGARLRAFKSSLGSAQEARDDDFLIGSALDAVDSAAKDHRDLLAEQEEEFKHKKKQGHTEASHHSE